MLKILVENWDKIVWPTGSSLVRWMALASSSFSSRAYVLLVLTLSLPRYMIFTVCTQDGFLALLWGVRNNGAKTCTPPLSRYGGVKNYELS